MRRLLLALGLATAAACLDFEGAAADYCLTHAALCAPDAGSGGGGELDGGVDAG